MKIITNLIILLFIISCGKNENDISFAEFDEKIKVSTNSNEFYSEELKECSNLKLGNKSDNLDISFDKNTVLIKPKNNFKGNAKVELMCYKNGEEYIYLYDVNVKYKNHNPTAQNQIVYLNEDEPKNFIIEFEDLENNVNTINFRNGTIQGTLSGDFNNYVYSPNPNYNGTDSVEFQVVDEEGLTSDWKTITFIIEEQNDIPLSNDLSFLGNEDNTINFTLSCSDVDGDSLSYLNVVNPTNGSLSCLDDSCSYTPNVNYNGSDSFTYKCNDGTSDSNISTVSLTLNPVNDNPISYDINTFVNEDDTVNFTLSCSDVDGDYLSYSILTNVSNGSLSCISSSCSYTGNTNYNGSDSFTYKCNDGISDSNISTGNIIVSSINDNPIADSLNITTDEDTLVNFSLSSFDSDGDSLTFTIVSDVSNGTLSCVGSSCSYTPNADYNGVDTFTYKVNDGTSDSNTATVNLTVNPVNDNPIASDIVDSLDEDLSLSVTLNCTDIDGDSLTYTVLSSPSNGSLSGTEPNITYTPDADYNGSDSFTYKCNDGTSDSNTATVSLTVNPVNDAPVSSDNSFVVNEDSTLNNSLSCSDSEGDSLTFTIVSDVSNGNLSGIYPNFTYTPDSNYNGSDSFTYKCNDGTSDSNISTINITVTPIDDPTIAHDETLVTNEDTAGSVTLTLDEVDGDSLTWTIVSLPSNGTLSGTEPNLTYTPDADYNGSDSFTYKVNDGTSDSNTATVSITVNAVNDAPVASDITDSLDENSSLGITLIGTDVDGDPLTYTIVSSPSNGTVSCTTNSCTYTPDTDYYGNDSFTYKVNDGTSDSNTATVSLTINEVTNNLPTSSDVTYKYNINSSSELIDISASDSDGDSLTVEIVSSPSNGSASVVGNKIQYNLNGWTLCSTEGNTCSISGTKLIKYGSTTNFTSKEKTSSFICDNQEFSDPHYATAKSCSYIDITDTITYRVYDGQGYSNTSTISISYNQWYDKDYETRVKISLNNHSLSTSLEDIPILIKLDSSKIDYTKVQLNGEDLRFINSGGEVLSYEIEKWNPSGESFIWVKLGYIYNNENKFIWLYYDNPSATDGQNKENVWTNGYVGVWHFSEITGSVLDSTSNNNDGTVSGSIVRNNTGIIGNSYYSNSGSSCISIPNNSSHKLTDTLTIETWAYSILNSQNSVILEKDIYNGSQWRWWYSLGNNGGDITEAITDDSLNTTYYQTPSPYFQLNQWTHIAVTYNDITNTASGYDNGLMNISYTSATRNLYTGNDGQDLILMGDCSSNGFRGYVDEIRLSNKERSSDWIKVQYDTMIDAIQSYSIEENF